MVMAGVPSSVDAGDAIGTAHAEPENWEPVTFRLGYGHVIATQRNQLGTILPNPRRIRGFSNGELVVDSTDVLGVWDNRHYPSWYFPYDDVLVDLEPSGETRDVAGVGVVLVHDVLLGNRRLVGPAVVPDMSCDPAVQGRVRFDFDAVDRWFEEDVEVFSEPRNPYVRVDALASSRHVKVSHAGEVVAETTKPVLLFETGVATRFYVPAVHVRLDFLARSDRSTSCPYKGFASYFSITVDGSELENSAWTYQTPFPAVTSIAGMICFYTNRLVVEVDGVQVTT
jgi:uncharacterized protein (DUF427 family)